MKVHLIIERDEHGGSAWVIDAIDEFTIDEWNGRYPDEVKMKLEAVPQHRRVLIVEIPDDSFEKLWPPDPTVKGTVVE